MCCLTHPTLRCGLLQFTDDSDAKGAEFLQVGVKLPGSGGVLTTPIPARNGSHTFLSWGEHDPTTGKFVGAMGVVGGCTDSTAPNYDSRANLDDGSCKFDFIYGSTKKNWFSARLSCKALGRDLLSLHSRAAGMHLRQRGAGWIGYLGDQGVSSNAVGTSQTFRWVDGSPGQTHIKTKVPCGQCGVGKKKPEYRACTDDRAWVRIIRPENCYRMILDS